MCYCAQTHLFVDVGRDLQALLDEPRPVLILAKRHHMPQQVPQPPLPGFAVRASEFIHQRVADGVAAGAAAAAAATEAVVVAVAVAARTAVVPPGEINRRDRI